MSYPPHPKAAPQSVLVVEDDPSVRRVLAAALRRVCDTVEEVATATDAITSLERSQPDLVLLDLNLADRKGQEVLERVRSQDRLRLVPVLMMSGSATSEERLQAYRAGVTEFLLKPFDVAELAAHVRALLDLKSFTDTLEEAERVLVSLARTVDARDPYTAGHSHRVSIYAGMLGERIGLSPTDWATLRQGSLFHDLGKIAVRDSILFKPGRLTTEEFAEMKRHTVVGGELLAPMRTLAAALPIVIHHHEKLDGSGYPDGIGASELPLLVRIVSVADVFDGLTSSRLYREGYEREAAIDIMIEEAERGWWDRDLVHAFQDLVGSAVA